MNSAALAVFVATLSGWFAQSAGTRFEPFQPQTLSAAATLVNAPADFDTDGDVDLFVGFNGAPNRLYRNDKGTLSDVASSLGLADARATRAAAWGDFDADGDPDLLIGFAPAGGASVLRLVRNDRTRFVDVTDRSGLSVPAGAVRQPSWIDIDGDNDLDLFVAFRDRPNALFRNNGGRFEDVAPAIGLADPRKSVGAVWFDYDDDGDIDVYVANMDGDANALFRNDAGKFSDVAPGSPLEWAGRRAKDTTNGTVRPCAADVDNDGRLDLFAANYGPNGLLLNRGRGQFEDASAAWGIAIDGRYDTCAFDDFDNDGHIDLYVNGTVTGGTSYRDYLFRNTGTRFEDVTPENLRALNADHGAAWADLDLDGDVDLALTGSGADVMPLLFRNLLPDADARRSTFVRVVDADGRTPRPGAVVKLFAWETRKLLGTRLVDTGSGYDAQGDVPVHFGVPPQVDALCVEVRYPHAGRFLTSECRRLNPRDWGRKVLVIRLR
jgi:VCBS repeat protein